jgi:hypothetical protein
MPLACVFLDTIYVAFKMRRGGIVKILQHCQKVGRFPLHSDEPRDKRLFRISVSLADGIPDCLTSQCASMALAEPMRWLGAPWRWP